MAGNEWLFAVLLLVSASLITTGAALAWLPAGFMVGGLLLAVWSWFILADDGTKADEGELA